MALSNCYKRVDYCKLRCSDRGFICENFFSKVGWNCTLMVGIKIVFFKVPRLNLWYFGRNQKPEICRLLPLVPAFVFHFYWKNFYLDINLLKNTIFISLCSIFKPLFSKCVTAITSTRTNSKSYRNWRFSLHFKNHFNRFVSSLETLFFRMSWEAQYLFTLYNSLLSTNSNLSLWVSSIVLLYIHSINWNQCFLVGIIGKYNLMKRQESKMNKVDL